MSNFAGSKTRIDEKKGIQKNRVVPTAAVLIILVRYHTVHPLARGERSGHRALASFPHRACPYEGSIRDHSLSVCHRFFG